jgi:hypothetical protein
MASSERTDRPAWQVLVALAGAATAIVIVVYLVGGAIVWERLHVLGLPANQAVAPLPRNLLLIDGVRALAWPVALGLVAAGLVSLLAHIFRFGARVILVACAVLLVVWIATLVSIRIFDTGPKWQHYVFLATLGILVAVAVVAAHRQLVAVRRVALAAGLAIASVSFVVEAADIWTVPVRMEYARVRLTSPPNVIRGFYIGATSDAVYLAPNHTCHVGREVLALPQSRVVKVRVFTSSEAWPKGGGPDKCKSPP